MPVKRGGSKASDAVTSLVNNAGYQKITATNKFGGCGCGKKDTSGGSIASNAVTRLVSNTGYRSIAQSNKVGGCGCKTTGGTWKKSSVKQCPTCGHTLKSKKQKGGDEGTMPPTMSELMSNASEMTVRHRRQRGGNNKAEIPIEPKFDILGVKTNPILKGPFTANNVLANDFIASSKALAKDIMYGSPVDSQPTRFSYAQGGRKKSPCKKR